MSKRIINSWINIKLIWFLRMLSTEREIPMRNLSSCGRARLNGIQKRGKQRGFLSCRRHKRKKNTELGLKALVQQGRGTGTQQRNGTGWIQRGAPSMATHFDKGDEGPSFKGVCRQRSRRTAGIVLSIGNRQKRSSHAVECMNGKSMQLA